MDVLIAEFGKKGILVLLDLHSFRPDSSSSDGFWYSSTYNEATVIQMWNKLIQRYKNTWNVFAIDVKNEPFSSTWNTGNLATDFNKAAERIGEVIIKDTNWLVFVEGLTCQSGCFWGENLQGV